MTTYEARFDIETKADAQAVRQLLEQAHNVFREELEGTHRSDDTLDEVLTAFEHMYEASNRMTTGRLTVTYEQDE